MAYQGGRKKPLNQLENPIYPNIKEGPPRFRWTGKSWHVDQGRTLIDGNQDFPEFAGHAVLVQSRDYNKQHAYGVSSHKDVVNLEFRPPLITMEDTMPLSRLPRPITVPRINPSGADDTSTRFTVQNNRPSEIHSFMTDRVKDDEWRPTFFCPIDNSLYENGSVLPDLEFKLPQVSATAGFRFASNGMIVFDEPRTLEHEKTVGVRSNPEVPFISDIESGMEHLTLDYNRPQVSATSGVQMSVTPLGTNEKGEVILDYKRPQVSVTAGHEIPYGSNVKFDEEYQLEEKLHEDFHVSSSSPFQTKNNFVEPQRVRESPLSYSYSVYKNVPYHEQNERHKVPFQRKKESLSSYKGYENRVFIPRTGIETQKVKLRQK